MTSFTGPRLRIAVLSRGFLARGGGAERYSISLVEALAHQHDVHVFAQHIDHAHPSVTYHRLPECVRRPSWINLLCYDLRSWWATRKEFDVVHSHENTWHGQIQTVHVRPVKIGLFHGREGWSRMKRYLQVATSPRLWTYMLIERARFAAAPDRVVIATSEPLQRELERAYPCLRGHIAVLPPGVHLPPPIDASYRVELRQSMGLTENSMTLLFVGNDYAKKGLAPLLHALASQPEHVSLLVVGNTAHIPEFSALARTLGVQERVRFIGAVDDVAPYYQVADALVHPTTEDTFAMVVLEAMAHGLPVLVSGAQWCGISASLHHEQEALILQNPHSVEEINTAISELINDSNLRRRLSDAGRQFAEQYNWENLARKQEALYAKVLRQSQPQLDR